MNIMNNKFWATFRSAIDDLTDVVSTMKSEDFKYEELDEYTKENYWTVMHLCEDVLEVNQIIMDKDET